MGANLDLANVDINNRVNKATAKLPPEAVAYGISVKKKSPDILLAISVYSPDSTFDDTFLSNFTSINLVDPIARIPGVGSTMIVGQRDYAMRFWVRPDKLAKLGLTGTDLANVIGEQNLVAPAGQVGQPPAKAGTQFQYTVNVKGRLTDPTEFEDMIVRTLPDGSILRMKDVARTELSGKSYTSFGRKDGIPATVLIIYQLPGANAIQTVDNVRKLLEETRKTFPPGLNYRISLDTTEFVEVAIRRSLPCLERRHHPRADRGLHLPGQFPRHVHPHAGGARLPGGNLRGVRGSGIFHQYAHHAGRRAGGRHRGGRRHRGRRSRGTPYRAWPKPAGGHRKGDGRGQRAGDGHRPGAVRRVRAGLVHGRHRRPVVPAVRDHHLHFRDPVGDRRPDAHARAMRHDASAAQGNARTGRAFLLRGFNKVFNKITDGLSRRRGLLPAAGGDRSRLPRRSVVWSGQPPDEAADRFRSERRPGLFLQCLHSARRRFDGTYRPVDEARRSGSEEHSRREEVLTTGGLNLLTNAYTSNNASIITMLKPWEERKSKEEQLKSILAAARKKFAAYPEAVSLVFPPPPINGLGNASGFVFELQDRVGRSPQELAAAKDKFMQAMAKRPELTGIYSGFSTSVPQIKLDIDRDKVRTLNIPDQ